jgi:hypothetical protein
MASSEPTEVQRAKYQAMARQLAPELDKASVVGQLYTADRTDLKRARILGDENAPRIPKGAYVYFKARHIDDIKPGTFVFVRIHGSLLVRRYLGKTVTSKGILLHCKADRASTPEAPLPDSALVGVIEKAKVGDQAYDPNRMSLAERFRNALTDYGTVHPLKKIGRLFSVFLPPAARAKGVEPPV